jgi:SM-20-related protein
MTGKQILDAFSETLMQDERILSPRERELLRSLLQNSRVASGSSPETQAAVTEAIARSVGETVAQRAFALLGGSVVEQILARSGIPVGTDDTILPTTVQFAVPEPPSGPRPTRVPQPPSRVPQPPSGPGPMGVPQPPSGPLGPMGVPQPPSGPGPMGVPQPPSGPGPAGVPEPPSRHQPSRVPQPPSGPGPQGLRPVSVPSRPSSGVGVLEAPVHGRAECVVLDEFLAPQELDELISYTLEHEPEFQNSEVISPSGDPGVIDYSHRRSRVLMDLGKHEEVILERVRHVLPRVLDQLGIEKFPVTHTEAQITASNDGDFFGQHSDDAQEMIASRRMTFVYFFHREPRPFAGGELRLHDSRGESEQQISAGSYRTGGYQTEGYQTIVPRQNQIVFFPCSVLHEITPVECPSGAFADSRFTLNGWLHK